MTDDWDKAISETKNFNDYVLTVLWACFVHQIESQNDCFDGEIKKF